MNKSIKLVVSFLAAVLLFVVGTTTTQAKSKHHSKALVTFKQTKVKADENGTFTLRGTQKKGVTVTFNGKTVDLLPDQNGKFETSVKSEQLPKKIKVVAKKDGVKKTTKRTIMIDSKSAKMTDSSSTKASDSTKASNSSMSEFQTTSLLNHTDPDTSMTAVDNSDSSMNDSSSQTSTSSMNNSNDSSTSTMRSSKHHKKATYKNNSNQSSESSMEQSSSN